MWSKAAVTKRGAVLLGKYVACDGFDETRPLRVITHAHSDHLLGLRTSLKRCEGVIMTPATRDLINVLKNPFSLVGENVRTLEYEETFEYEIEEVTLHYSDHILGAAQVLVEDEEGTRILYSGDFRIPYTPIIQADVLVIEATYGNPYRVRPFQSEVKNVLISLVEEAVKQGPVYLFGYHGKIQEVMQILHEARVGVPFIAPEKVFRVSRVCEKYGMRFGRHLLLSSSEEAQSMLKNGDSFLAFFHLASRGRVNSDAFRIYVSGWEFRSPCHEIGENEYRVALSAHSDFYGLLRYVEGSRPKMVITDNHRSGDAVALAKEIERRLKIPAKPLPP
ncbi:MAG: MBL fold metallo-hydrolase [Candidatus Bathyarchaeia archaeon]